jgi:tetratricopeptide (TPR) repeat protein
MQSSRKSYLLEKYLRQYEAKPKSRVFAPLAESYRQVGMIKEAFEVLQKGMKYYPTYTLSYIVLAHCYYDVGDFQRCYSTLKPILAQNYDNLKLQKLMGRVSFQLQYFDEALAAFKFVLFVSPSDKEALEKVRELEAQVEVIEGAGTSQVISSVIKNNEENATHGSIPSADSQFDDWTQVHFSDSENKVNTLGHELSSDASVALAEKQRNEEPAPINDLPESKLTSEDDISTWEMKPLNQDIQSSEDWVDDMVDETLEIIGDDIIEDQLPQMESETQEKVPEVEVEVEVPSLEMNQVSLNIDHEQKESIKLENEEKPLKENVEDQLGNLQDDTEVPLVTHTLVDIYMAQKHYDKAYKVLNKILELDPDDQKCLKKLGELEKILGPPENEPTPIEDKEDIRPESNIRYIDIEKRYLSFLEGIQAKADDVLLSS